VSFSIRGVGGAGEGGAARRRPRIKEVIGASTENYI
jgi:hypothetical protein